MRTILKTTALLALAACLNGCATTKETPSSSSSRSYIQSPPDKSGTEIHGSVSVGGAYRVK
ncbi:MAG: hypothetical protein RLZZ350_1657 [Verrucomicrobiota bacterium]